VLASLAWFASLAAVPFAPPGEPATLPIADLDDGMEPGFSSRRIEGAAGICVHDAARHTVGFVSGRGAAVGSPDHHARARPTTWASAS
jgi:hypothetical protein